MPPPAEAAATPGVVDAHALVFSGDTQRYPPSPPGVLPSPQELANPMTAERLMQHMDAQAVTRAVLVQRGAFYGFDNSYVCEAAASAPSRLVAVCGIDTRQAGADLQLRRWVRDHGARGLRFMEPVRGGDLSWLAGDAARAVWREAVDLGVVIDVHVFAWCREAGLQALRERVREFPGATVVINNLSNLDVRAGPPEHGLDALLRAFVEVPRVHLKFTTIPLAALDAEARPLAPMLDHLVAAFGASRLMWGSDVPVGGRSYAQMRQLGIDATANQPPAARAQLLGATALSIYFQR